MSACHVSLPLMLAPHTALPACFGLGEDSCRQTRYKQ